MRTRRRPGRQSHGQSRWVFRSARRGDRAGADGVHPDTARNQLAGEGAGKRQERRLRGSVDTRVRHADVRVDGCVEHNGRRKYGPLTLIAKERSNAASSHCSTGLKSAIPALTNRMSSPPNSWRRVAATSFWAATPLPSSSRAISRVAGFGTSGIGLETARRFCARIAITASRVKSRSPTPDGRPSIRGGTPLSRAVATRSASARTGSRARLPRCGCGRRSRRSHWCPGRCSRRSCSCSRGSRG